MKTSSFVNRSARLRRTMQYVWLPSLLIAVALTRADVPPVSVSVTNADGKVVYTGATNARDTFATPQVGSGEYVVQIKSTNPHFNTHEHYLLVASAGKKKVIADNVNGEMFTGPGVAMKVKVVSRTQITGQIARGAAPAFAGNPNLKVINGKIYRWDAGETGSHLGGRWVDQTVAESRQIVRMHASWLRHIQDHAGEGSLLNRYNGQGHAISYADNDD